MKKIILLIYLCTIEQKCTSSNKKTEKPELYSNICGSFAKRDYIYISFGASPNFTVYQILDTSVKDPKRFKVDLSLEKKPLKPHIISLQVVSWDSIDPLRFVNFTQEVASKFIPIQITFSDNQGSQIFAIEKNKEITMYDKNLKIKNTLKIDQLTSPLYITDWLPITQTKEN